MWAVVVEEVEEEEVEEEDEARGQPMVVTCVEVPTMTAATALGLEGGRVKVLLAQQRVVRSRDEARRGIVDMVLLNGDVWLVGTETGCCRHVRYHSAASRVASHTRCFSFE